MRWLLRSRAQTIGGIVVLLAMLATGFFPLFGGPGYESALAAGLLLPSVAAVCSAIDAANRARPPFDAFSHGLASGTLLGLIGWLTTLVHGLRAGFCDPLGGTLLFALGPVLGAVMGGAWGTLAGELSRPIERPWPRNVLAIVLALLGPAAGVLLSLWRFYTSPIIFAFDPFFGFFAGTVYDTVVDVTVPLLTYRVGSALTLLAAGILAAHLVRNERGRLALRTLHRPGVALLGAACATTSLVLLLEGWRLGHWQTAATIARELGGQARGARCDVVYARVLRSEDVQLFTRDCDQQLRAVERYFELGDTGRVTAYLFQNAGDKRRLMGAAETLIAKPWRREIYVQAAGFPHPVLAHELAHVVAGFFGRGPFKIAGDWHGLVPNPGLIEGVAVAAAPDQDALLPSEWTRAMLDLGLVPPLKRIFALGFLGENASKSYTVAGAFVGFVRDKYGAQTVRRWYKGEPLQGLTKQSMDQLESRFRDGVARLPLPETAQAIAKARFDRPAVWGRKCPHAIDLYKRDAEVASARGDYVQALQMYDRVLVLDPHDDGAKIDRAACILRRGDRKAAVEMLSSVAIDESASRLVRNRALGQMADLDLEAGQLDAAAQRYAQLGTRTLDQDQKRTLEVKSSTMSDTRARRAISAYLIGSSTRGVDPTRAGALLGQWIGEDPTDGLPEYLLGRDLAGRGMYAEAADRLDRALAKRLAGGSVLREALRQRIIVACALGDAAAAKRAYDIWADKGGEPLASRRDTVRRLMERCTGVEIKERRAD
jgi:tetratricopeptide (TPR) repeat protein